MTRRRCILRALFGVLAAAGAAPLRAQADDLDKLFALFAAQGERRKAFVERRHSVLFRNPPEARGTLYFKPPALLERDVVSPRREKVRIDAESVTLQTEGEQGKLIERKASLATMPQLANLVLTIRATLAGDLATLRRMYLIDLKQPLPHWRIELAPLDEPVAGAVSAISMAGERGEVQRIQFTETTGDRTELLLSPMR
jgi:hypothetical protein